jgi:hypothetical protein
MKKLIVIFSVFVLAFPNSHAQWYNKYFENRDINELDTGELSFLIRKSNNTRITGLILTVSGIAITTFGAYEWLVFKSIVYDDYTYPSTAPFQVICAIGLVATIGGVHTWITGGNRKKEIIKMLDAGRNDINLQIKPSVRYSSFNNGYYPCISLVIQF